MSTQKERKVPQRPTFNCEHAHLCCDACSNTAFFNSSLSAASFLISASLATLSPTPWLLSRLRDRQKLNAV